MTIDIPLSPIQSDLLSQQFICPWDRAAYCLGAWEVTGSLGQETLAAAISYVHQRHEALGAAYLPQRGGPVARTMRGAAPPLTVLAEADSMDDALLSLRRELSRELDISAGQVWRTALVPRVPQPDGGISQLLGFVVHHIAFDGWSESVLAADLAAAYNAYHDGADPALAELLSLAEASALVESYRRHADLRGQITTLGRRLRGVPQLAWPAAEDIGPGGDLAGPLSVRRTAEPAEVAALDTTARALGVSRFVLLLAAYGRALARMTGQEDFAVAIPVTRRLDNRLDASVGCYIEMACIRMDRDALAAGADGVAGTQAQMDLAFRTRDVGFGEVVRAVNPPRGRKTALAQSLFVSQDHPVPRLDIRGRRTRFLRLPYLDIPAEVLIDVWPLRGRRLKIVTSFLPSAIGRASADELMRLFADACQEMTGVTSMREGVS